MKVSPGCGGGDLHTFVVPGPTLHRSDQRAEHIGAALQLAYLGTGPQEEELSGAHTEVSFPHGKKPLEAPKSKDSLPGMSRDAEPSLAVSTDFMSKLSLHVHRSDLIFLGQCVQ